MVHTNDEVRVMEDTARVPEIYHVMVRGDIKSPVRTLTLDMLRAVTQDTQNNTETR